MRKLLLLLLFPGMVYCQAEDPGKKEKLLNAEQTDSVVSSYTKKADSLARVRQSADSIRIQQSMNSNINSLLRMQKENRERERKASIRRIAFGVAMLVILIIGLNRRRRKK